MATTSPHAQPGADAPPAAPSEHDRLVASGGSARGDSTGGGGGSWTARAPVPSLHRVADAHAVVGGQYSPCVSSQQTPPAGMQPPPHGTVYPEHAASVAAPASLGQPLGDAAHVPFSQQYGV